MQRTMIQYTRCKYWQFYADQLYNVMNPLGKEAFFL